MTIEDLTELYAAYAPAAREATAPDEGDVTELLTALGCENLHRAEVEQVLRKHEYEVRLLLKRIPQGHSLAGNPAALLVAYLVFEKPYTLRDAWPGNEQELAQVFRLLGFSSGNY